MHQNRAGDSGFTVVELVVAAAILAFVAMGVLGALGFSAAANAATTTREEALNLANQKLERARNLPYDKVGTVNGNPSGTILNSEDVGQFTVVTVVSYGRDAVTRRSTSKNIRVVVSWDEPRPGELAVETNIVGKATGYEGDVEVTVLDADTSDPVPGVLVSIQPATGTKQTMPTDSDGVAFFGHVVSGSITITAAKSGYSFSSITGTVVTNSLNKWTMLAYKASKGTVTVKDQNNNLVPNSSVKIVGPSGTLTVVSDSAGQAVFNDLFKGTYTITTTGPTGYSAGTGTLGILAGGSAYTSTVTVTKQARLLVTVVDDNGNEVAGATVAVTGPGTVTPASTTSDANGLTVHSLAAAGTYTASVSKTGYLGSTGSKAVASGADGSLTVAIEALKPTYFIVKVVDPGGTAISGATVSVTGPGSVTPASGTSASTGLVSFTVGLPGVYSATASKTGYTSGTGSSTFIPNGGTQTINVVVTPQTDGVLSVKYTSTPSPNPKIVYIYRNTTGTTWVNTGVTLSFTAKNQTKNVTLEAGTYAVSVKNAYSGTARQGVVTVGGTTSVSLSSSN